MAGSSLYDCAGNPLVLGPQKSGTHLIECINSKEYRNFEVYDAPVDPARVALLGGRHASELE